jgi:hypothetical protein
MRALAGVLVSSSDLRPALFSADGMCDLLKRQGLKGDQRPPSPNSRARLISELMSIK